MDQNSKEWEENVKYLEQQVWEVAKSRGYSRCQADADFLGAVFMHQALSALRKCDGVDINEGKTISSCKERIGDRSHGIADYALGAALTLIGLAAKKRSLSALTGAWKVLGGFQSLWHSTEDDLREVSRLVLESLGRKGANARHAETAKMKAEVLAYWRENIGSKVSNEKAAGLLSKQFPLAHRTLRDYVAEAKRTDIRPAGTP